MLNVTSTVKNSVRSAIPLALAAVALLAGVTPARALTWTNVACDLLGAAECPQIGTPVLPCNCGLWKDAPGVATISRIETAFVFVNSDAEIDESAAWKAPLAAPIGNMATLEVRAAVNDNSDLKVILYSALAANFNTCATVGADVAAVLDWNDVEDDSRFFQRTAPIVLANVVGVCVIVTDQPDAAVPVSNRSSVIIDYIALVTAAGAKTFIEEFQLTN